MEFKKLFTIYGLFESMNVKPSDTEGWLYVQLTKFLAVCISFVILSGITYLK